jgi:hypothetical protein
MLPIGWRLSGPRKGVWKLCRKASPLMLQEKDPQCLGSIFVTFTNSAINGVFHSHKSSFCLLPTSIRLRGVWWRAGLERISALIFNMFWEILRHLLFRKEFNIPFSPQPFARGREMLHYRNGVFLKSRKVTLTSSYLSVCPSVRMEQLCSHWTDFHVILYLSNFRKSA